MRLVYLSPVPWASFAQRPHKFVEWFRLETGGDVLWIDPYPTRLPNLGDFNRPRNFSSTGIDVPDWMKVFRPFALPIEPLPFSGHLNRQFWWNIIKAVEEFSEKGETILGIGKPSELALQLLKRNYFKISFYDAMDDFPAFHQGLSRLSMARKEKIIVEQVSKVIVSSTALYKSWKSKREVLLARNACDIENLPNSNNDFDKNPQILGYLGTFGKWFDWDLVISIAHAKPESKIHLIGPMYVQPPTDLPENIKLFPPCSHREAIETMQKFSVGLIPFKKTELTDSVDPIKYYEYRALGLPVISSSFGEMMFHSGDPGLFILDKDSDFANVINMALSNRFDNDAIQNFRINNSWKVRFSSLGLFD